MSMLNKKILFFALLLLFVAIFFIRNIEFNFDDLFLWNLFSYKLWLFIILWICLLIIWKEIIDESE